MIGCSVLLLRALSGLATWFEAYTRLVGFDRKATRKRLAGDVPPDATCTGYAAAIVVGATVKTHLGRTVVMHTLRARKWLTLDAITAFISTVMVHLDGAEEERRLRVVIGSRTHNGAFELAGAMRRELELAGTYCARYILTVNVGISHWGVVCIDGLNGLNGLNGRGAKPTIAYYDSGHDDATARMIHEGLRSINGLHEAEVKRAGCRQQPNDFDCGVCACVNILHLAHGVDVPSGAQWTQPELDDARLFVAARIFACVDHGPYKQAPKRARRRARSPGPRPEQVVISDTTE
jgi:hypothetical protein